MTYTTHSLSEVAEMTGRPEATLRKHIQRGRLVATKNGNRTVIEDKDLERYLAAEALEETADVVRLPEASVPGEIGNMIQRLPPKVAQAILDGMPASKKGSISGGSPEPFQKATAGLPKRQPVDEDNDDPHFGHGVGYQHRESPKWKRVTKSTWELDGATFTWNGLVWEGGGVRDGVTITDPDVSPGAPASDRRPLQTPKLRAK